MMLKRLYENIEKKIHISVDGKIKNKIDSMKLGGSETEIIVGGSVYIGGSKVKDYMDRKVIQYELLKEDKADLAPFADKIADLLFVTEDQYVYLAEKTGIADLALAQIRKFADLLGTIAKNEVDRQTVQLIIEGLEISKIKNSTSHVKQLTNLTRKMLNEYDRDDYLFAVSNIEILLANLQTISTREELDASTEDFRKLEVIIKDKEYSAEARCQLKKSIADNLTALEDIPFPSSHAATPNVLDTSDVLKKIKLIIEWEKTQIPSLQEDEKRFDKLAEGISAVIENINTLMSSCIKKPLFYISYLIYGTLLEKIAEKKFRLCDMKLLSEKLDFAQLDQLTRKFYCFNFN
jgi:hypothetical protein